MKNPLRAMRFACAVLGFASLVAVGPAESIDYGVNHYILGCADHCSGMTRPVVLGGNIDATFTGSWYDPAQSGQGLTLEVLPDHRVMAFWFTFNPAGTQQTWLAGSGTYASNVATIDPVAMPTGGRWIPNFDAAEIVDNAWGTMTLTFSDSNHGRVEFKSVLGYGTGSMNLTRLTWLAGITATTVSAPGQWIPTGGFNVTRYGYTTTLLTNGKVLIAGGGNNGSVNWVNFDSAELYDPSTGTWRLTGHLSAARGGHTATLLPNGQVLVAGGSGVSSFLDSAELYDPATGTWRPAGNLRLARANHTATLLNTGKILVAGGFGRGPEAISELYDPAAGSWSTTGMLIAPRAGHQATLLQDGRVLVTGGTYDGEAEPPLAETEIYDPVAGTWSKAGGLNVARFIHTATLLPNGKVLVVGGSNIAELFDPATGQWSPTGSLITGRHYPMALLLQDGKVLVAGGYDLSFSRPLDSTELYDPVSGSWSGSAPLVSVREGGTPTLLPGGNVLLAGIFSQVYGTAFPPGTITPAFTGAWFDPAQRGHGILVEILPDARLLAWWFAFNPAGTEQSWFGGLGTYRDNRATISAVNQTTGGRFIPNFDPSKIVNNAWGALTFTFTDCDHGRVDFVSTAGYGAGSMNVTRLTQPAGVVCP